MSVRAGVNEGRHQRPYRQRLALERHRTGQVGQLPEFLAALSGTAGFRDAFFDDSLELVATDIECNQHLACVDRGAHA
jgi:hypothetical protein